MSLAEVIAAAKELNFEDRKILIRAVLSVADTAEEIAWNITTFLHAQETLAGLCPWFDDDIGLTEDDKSARPRAVPLSEAIAALKKTNLISASP